MSTVGCHEAVAPPLGGILVSQGRGKLRRRTCSSCQVVKRKADFPPLSNDPICRGCVMLASPTTSRKVDIIPIGGQELGGARGGRFTTMECGGANRLSPVDRDGSSLDIPTTVYAPPIRLLSATKAPQFVLASGAEFA